MIAIFFNSVLNEILNLLASILPSSSGLPSNVQTGITTFLNYLNGINYVFPVDSILTIMGLFITFEIALFLITLIRFVANMIRGSGA